MGVDPVLGYHTYFAPSGKQKVTWEDYDYTFDSIYFNKDIVFAYDRTANTLKSETNFLVNAGKNVVYKVNEYEKPMLARRRIHQYLNLCRMRASMVMAVCRYT